MRPKMDKGVGREDVPVPEDAANPRRAQVRRVWPTGSPWPPETRSRRRLGWGSGDLVRMPATRSQSASWKGSG